MFYSCRLALLLFLVLTAVQYACRAEAQQYTLEYQAAPVDNPLKGLVPYARPHPNRFPHSLEFSYLAFSDLVIGPDRYDWRPLEKLLEDVKSRRNQTVFRVYLEYPDGKSGIPKFLIEDGLKVHRWRNSELAFQGGKGDVQTPDYENPKLRKALRQFIAALGKKYDGDPRIGYVTAGLLGLWGEWHDYPKGDDLWASKQTQIEVLEAYELAFNKTPVLLRYPAGTDHYDQAANHDRRFGYHDDSFAHATLHTGREEDSWYFQSLLIESGTTEKWKTLPIGGEIRPEVWGCCFDSDPCTAAGQSFAQCRDEMHVTWLMDTGLFQNKAGDERLGNAKREVRKMGYEFFVKSVEVQQDVAGARLMLEVENTGIAPFYHPGWSIKVRSLDGAENDWMDTNLELTQILPGEVKRLQCKVGDGISGKFLIGVPNPMSGGKSLRFANKTQDEDKLGWLTIGR
jgi:hypothetical protein